MLPSEKMQGPREVRKPRRTAAIRHREYCIGEGRRPTREPTDARDEPRGREGAGTLSLRPEHRHWRSLWLLQKNDDLGDREQLNGVGMHRAICSIGFEQHSLPTCWKLKLAQGVSAIGRSLALIEFKSERRLALALDH